MSRLEIIAVDGIGEIIADTDLGALIAGLDLGDGDIVMVTSKVVSKAEGLVVTGDRDDAIAGETVRVVARRGPTSIVENHLGLVMAAAGIDASNVTPGQLVLLPRDPDASARRIREAVAAAGSNVAVLITDTAGRAWRNGQTDITIGAAGINVLESLAGAVDGYGNPLAVTEPAIGDELAGAADLVKGKLSGRPVAIVRGLADRVLAPGDHGSGARAALRPRSMDMFALGSREAVVAAVAGRDSDCFGSAATAEELATALRSCGLAAEAGAAGVVVESEDPRVDLVAFAHGWRRTADRPSALLPITTSRPANP
jgi:coenzyme F420-0:L-glutamate ligase/coenzyme F420-1:gamma-L-glutamate ligase